MARGCAGSSVTVPIHAGRCPGCIRWPDSAAPRTPAEIELARVGIHILPVDAQTRPIDVCLSGLFEGERRLWQQRSRAESDSGRVIWSRCHSRSRRSVRIIQEAACLRVEHLDLGEFPLVRMAWHGLHGKGDKWRRWPLWHQTADLLALLLQSLDAAPPPNIAVFSAHGCPLIRFGDL